MKEVFDHTLQFSEAALWWSSPEREMENTNAEEAVLFAIKN